MCDLCRSSPHDPRCPGAIDRPMEPITCTLCNKTIRRGELYYDFDAIWCEDCVYNQLRTLW